MTETRRWLVLAVVLMGTFMAILDVAIVNVAIPSIRSDLHASFDLQTAIHRDELFKIPNLMVFADDKFYFIKPLRRRFWLSRAALADADQIARTVHAAMWK